MKFMILIMSILFTTQLVAEDTWIKTYQPFGSGSYYARDVLVCSDGGYAVNGYYRYNDPQFPVSEVKWGFLIKTDSGGNYQWAKKDTVSWMYETESTAMVQTDDGGILSSVCSFFPYREGSVLIKRDSNGNREWIVNNGNLYVGSMDKTNDGDIILGGRMNNLPTIRKITQNGEEIWTQSYGINGISYGVIRSIISLHDNGFAATGHAYFDETGSDIIILKTDSEGDTIWTKTYDSLGYDTGHCVMENIENNIYVAGTWDVGLDGTGVLIKLTNSGELIYILFNDDNNYFSFRSMIDNSTNIVGYRRGKLYAYSYEGESLWISDVYSGTGARGDKSLSNTDNGYILTGEVRINWENYILLAKTDLVGNVVAIDNDEIILPSINIECFPNPFNPDTTIRLELAEAGRIELSIYNIKGQKVRNLLDAHTEPGIFTCNWNGRDDNGRPVASGQYFIKLKQNGEQTVEKVMLVK
jgi:hypothetical protein